MNKKIALFVSGIHLLIVSLLLCHHVWTNRWQPPRPMVVKTIAFAPPPPPAPKIVSPKKPAASPKPVAVKKNPALKEIAKSIETITGESKVIPKEMLKVPEKKPVEKKQIQTDPNYAEFLVAYLQNTLDLPEYGEVKVEIEIDANGKLIQSQIITSKSAKNAKFLQEELVLLSYPIPPTGSQKFSITFKNQ